MSRIADGGRGLGRQSPLECVRQTALATAADLIAQE
jgi:hypothetical protein